MLSLGIPSSIGSGLNPPPTRSNQAVVMQRGEQVIRVLPLFSTAPRTPRRTCCPYAYELITVLRVGLNPKTQTPKQAGCYAGKVRASDFVLAREQVIPE
jgi:hypothetical protein